MNVLDYSPKDPRAFRGFVEGVQRLSAYLETNSGDELTEAEKYLTQAINSDPQFLPAQYYKSIVLTHARKSDDAIRLLEHLLDENAPFRTEILYNLAFAYAKKYKYESIAKSIDLVSKAKQSATTQRRTDLVLLLSAIQAWIFAVFAGREYKHPDDFERRKREYLPQARKIADSVLRDRRLRKIPSETQAAVTIEAHNAAGIALMRTGQFSSLFPDLKDSAWKMSLEHYLSALAIHPHDVRVLDNISTLKLIQASKAIRDGSIDHAKKFAADARDRAKQAISYNPNDRFRHYRLSQSQYLLGNLEGVHQAALRALDEPGEVSEDRIRALLDAKNTEDVSLILEQYPTD
jgi:tetratricopeptide (TPR) repeat protein